MLPTTETQRYKSNTREKQRKTTNNLKRRKQRGGGSDNRATKQAKKNKGARSLGKQNETHTWINKDKNGNNLACARKQTETKDKQRGKRELWIRREASDAAAERAWLLWLTSVTSDKNRHKKKKSMYKVDQKFEEADEMK